MKYYFVIICLGLIDLSFSQESIITNDKFQDKRIIHIGVENGLTQGSNYGILKDHLGFMWFTSNEGLNRYDGKEVVNYLNLPNDSTSLKGTYTNGIVEDWHGHIWVGSDQVLNCYNRQKNQFDFVHTKDSTAKDIPSVNFPFYADSTEVWYINNIEGILAYDFINKKKRVINSQFKYNRTNYSINSIFRVRDGSIWLKLEEGIVNINPINNETHYYFSNHPDNIFGKPSKIVSFLETSNGKIWMGSQNNIIIRDPSNEQFDIQSFPLRIYSTISDIAEDNQGNLWLGTEQDGLIVMNQHLEVLDQYSAQSKSSHKLLNNSAGSIYIDDQDLVWVNVDPEGIHLITPNYTAFQSYTGDLFKEKEFLFGGVRNFAERRDGKIWIATQKDGVVLFDPITEKIESRIKHNHTDLADHNESYVFVDKQNRTWVATYNGFYYLDGANENINRVINDAGVASHSSSNYIWNLVQTPNREFIFASEAGVYHMDNFQLESQLLFGGDKSTGRLFLNEENGLLLITEYHHGLHVINYTSWLNKESDKWSKNYLTEYNIKCIYQDSNTNSYWLGTSNGLLQIFPSEQWQSIDSIRRFGIADGLPSPYIYGILPDEQGRLWLSTNRGIASIDKETSHIDSYSIEDGIQGYEFNTNSFMKASTGELYFGGTNGFNRFDPNQITSNPSPPLNVEILTVQTVGEDHQSKSYTGILEQLTLPYLENTFSISYTAIDYLSQGNNHYKVWLEGYDKDWLFMEGDRSVRYTGIPEGNYIFHVAADNGDNVWTTEDYHMTIKVQPPWHRTIWAYCIWIASIFSLLFWFYKFQLSKKLAQQEAIKLKELDKSKTEFLNKITHDFRTPLTIINNELDNIKKHSDSKSIIRKNGYHLLQLVNSILSLNQKNTSHADKQIIQSNISDFIIDLLAPFKSIAQSQQKIFKTDITSSLITDFHPEMLQRVIYNLVDNALKHTNRDEEITVRLSSDLARFWILTVSDTGVGIPKEQLNKITDLYYQASEEGYGIGLHIVSEYVQNMNGKLHIDSKVDIGSTFRLQFPVTNRAPITESKQISISKKIDINKKIILPEIEGNDKNLILVVEDNYDLRRQLVDILSPHYEVINAEDGQEALEQIRNLVPDLIISDVMMPRINGIELLNTIRNHDIYRRIPCILLTAKSTHDDLITGLTFGADAYINKPFDREELLLRVNNLLQLLKNQQQHNLNGAFHSSKPKVADIENTKLSLLQDINGIIQEHLSDAEFRVAEISKKLHTNHTSLNRKLKLLTGVTLSTYLRKSRMAEAKKLLSTTDLSVTEICYQVGISDPAYFTKLYKKEFGVLPSEVRNT